MSRAYEIIIEKLKAEIQAKMLDALIALEDQGYIVLNRATDESSITIKGLIKINHAILYN